MPACRGFAAIMLDAKLRAGWKLQVNYEYGPSGFAHGCGGLIQAVLLKPTRRDVRRKKQNYKRFYGEGDTIEQAIEQAVMQAQ